MDTADKIEELESIAAGNGDTIRHDYSGRGMNGKTCIGIVTDDPVGTIEDAAAVGIRGAVTDSMGKQTIVYWPKITVP